MEIILVLAFFIFLGNLISFFVGLGTASYLLGKSIKRYSLVVGEGIKEYVESINRSEG
jgi:hypothetical protein